MDTPDETMTPAFNELSGYDRRKLKMAAAVTTLTADACADIGKHPWRYPAYAVYMLGMMLPTPGIHTIVMTGLLMAWAHAGMTEGARALKVRLNHELEPDSLMKNYAECVEKAEPAEFTVMAGPLCKKVMKSCRDDFTAATRLVRSRLPFFRGDAPNPS